MSTITIEALKEAGRCFVSYLLGTIVVCLGIIAMGINANKGVIAINWTVVLLTLLLGVINGLIGAIGRFTDKWQHEFGKENKTYPLDQAGKTPSLGWLNFFIK
jgi:hypothetical protein